MEDKITQKQIPFAVDTLELQQLAYNDCVYAWLLVHSYNDPAEYHSYIYKNSFTFKQIANTIHRTPQTVSKRFKQLIEKGFLKEKKVCGQIAYIIPYHNPFEYLDGETVIKLLNLPLDKQKEELIKTLAYLLKKKSRKRKEKNQDFIVTSKEILEEFGHSLGHRTSYERIRLNLTLLKGADIIKFKTLHVHDNPEMPELMLVYYVSDKGRASDEWLGK